MAHVHVNQRADTAVVVLLFVRRMSASPDSLCNWSSELLLQWLVVVVLLLVLVLVLALLLVEGALVPSVPDAGKSG